MTRMLRGMMVLAAAAVLCVSVASATMLKFEDLYTGIKGAEGPLDNYAGFSWSPCAYWLSPYSYMGNSGYRNGCFGNVCIGTIGAEDISMSSVIPFDLTSAFITSAWNLGEDAWVEGWRGDTQVYSTHLTDLDCTGTRNYAFNYKDIDTVWFKPGEAGTWYTYEDNGNGQHIVLDNIVVNENGQSVPTPEPGSLALMCSGLVSLIGLGGKKLRGRE